MPQTNFPTMIATCQGLFPRFNAPIPTAWTRLAQDKGFRAVARIIDRYHLALACVKCTAVNKVKAYTLRTARPQCQNCQALARETKARAAGATYLGRDPDDAHYLLLRLDCGHTVKRQTGLLDRAARDEVAFRCQTCLLAREEQEAREQGWTRLSVDPLSDPSYRLYRHDACGTDQRIARANMQSGRFGCAGCGTAWPSAPSALYLLAFTLSSGREVVKLGFSRNPRSRLHFQLRRDMDMPCAVLFIRPMATGHEALCTEKALHRHIRNRFLDAIVDACEWEGQIRVKSEIYDARIAGEILALLQAEPQSDAA